MPTPTQAGHVSPLARAVDERTAPCSVKTQVTRMQGLSLQQPSRGSPKRKLRFALDDEYAYKHRVSADGAAEEETTEVRATSPDPSLAAAVVTSSGDRKRSNSKQLEAAASMLKRKTSELVKVEGTLAIEEELADCGAVTTRALGSVECELVLKSEGLVLQAAPSAKQAIEVPVDRMELVFEPWRHELKFQLRRLPVSSAPQEPLVAPRSYIFQAGTVDDYKKWVNGIRGYGLTRSTSVDSLPVVAPAASVPRSPAIAGDLAVSAGDLCCAVDSFVYSSPPRVKHFMLVRHGHYINAHAPHVPDSEQVLSQIGRQQAVLTGKYLELLYNRARSRDDISIHHSDLKRAVETATIIGGDLACCSMQATSMLREGWPGQPYSTPHPAVPASSSSAAAAAATAAAASSSAAFHRLDVARMEKAFDLLIAPDAVSSDSCDDEQESHRVIVCHANLIRFFLCRALGIDPVGTWGHFEINHCSVTRIDVCENRPLKVVAVNETGHLPHSLLTSSEDHL